MGSHGFYWMIIIRNLVQRLSKEGTARRWLVGVAWEESVVLVVALLTAAVRPMKWYRRERKRILR